MSLPLQIALSGLLLALSYRFFNYIRTNIRASSNGCAPPRKRTGWDPLFGIDILFKDIKLNIQYKLVDSEYSRFSEVGATSYCTKSPLGPSIFTLDPENIQTVFANEMNTSFGNAPLRAPMIPFCGQGFLTSDGPQWEHSRALLSSTFSKDNVSSFSHFSSFVDSLISKIPADGSGVDMQDLLIQMFIDTSQDFIIGQAPGLMSGKSIKDGPIDSTTFLKEMTASMQSLGLSIIAGSLSALIPSSMTVAHWKPVWQYLDHRIDEVLRRGVGSSGSESKEDHRRSLLESVAQLTQDRKEIRAQVLQGIMAALDTTSTLISNALFHLSRHPEIWQKLREEALREGFETITATRLRSLPVLQNCIRETLRLNPVFTSIGRVALTDGELPSGGGTAGESKIFVPKGTTVIAHYYSLNRDRSVFGDDVEVFRPERWDTIRPTQWQYAPFGRGPRACLGREKALNEASYTLWRLARRFRVIESRDERPYAAVMQLITKNGNGCWVAFRE